MKPIRLWFTRLAEDDPDAARNELERLAYAEGGVLVRMAVELGICRRHLQRIVWKLDAWPIVEDARDRKKARAVA